MFKKFTSVVLCVLMVVSMLAVGVVSSNADVVLDSSLLYFDTEGSGWDMTVKGAKVGVYVFPLSEDVASAYTSWGGKRLQATKVSGSDTLWSYNPSVFLLEDGVQYKIIFTYNVSNAPVAQTYDLFFDTTCLGHIAYADGTMYENPVDSSKQAQAAFWKDLDPAQYGPVLQISSLGNVVGTCLADGETAESVLTNFISVVSTDTGKTGLDNARTYTVEPGTKTEQQLIDDIGEALGLTKDDVQAIFTAAEVETVWTYADSTLPAGEGEDPTEAPHVHTPGEAVQENVVAATCTTDGSYDEVVYCTECGEEISRETKTTAKLGHTAGEVQYENVIDATCKAEGSFDEVVYCTVCGEELSRTPVISEKIAHTPGEAKQENVVPATCSAEGSYDEVVYCTVCGEELSRETKTIDKIDHTPGEAAQENYEPASCNEEGSYDEVVYCSVCGEELSRETKTIDKIAHTPEDKPAIQNEVPATCDHEGSYDEVILCAVCGEELSRETKTIAKLDHTASEPVIENEIEATCEESGSYDSVVYCSVCGEEISRETITTDPKGHGELVFVDEVPATATESGMKAHYECPDCHKMFADATGTTEVTAKDLEIAPQHIRGDADADGEVTTLDATTIQRVLAEYDVPSYDAIAADADQDGVVDIIDVVLIQRVLAGICDFDKVPANG